MRVEESSENANFLPWIIIIECSLIAPPIPFRSSNALHCQTCLKHRSDYTLPLLKNIQCFSLPYRIKHKLLNRVCQVLKIQPLLTFLKSDLQWPQCSYTISWSNWALPQQDTRFPPSLYVFTLFPLSVVSLVVLNCVNLVQLELCFPESPSLHGSELGLTTGKCAWDLEGRSEAVAIALGGSV